MLYIPRNIGTKYISVHHNHCYKHHPDKHGSGLQSEPTTSHNTKEELINIVNSKPIVESLSKKLNSLRLKKKKIVLEI